MKIKRLFKNKIRLLLAIALSITMPISVQSIERGVENNAKRSSKIDTAKSSIEKRLNQVLKNEELGKLKIALASVKNLYNENDQHKEASVSYARLLLKTNQAMIAQQVIQPLVNTASDDWQVWFLLGSAQLLNGDLNNASDSLDRASSLNGEEVSIWVQRSIVEQEKGNSKAAINLLQVANSLSPNNTDVLINYAYANEKFGNYQKAVRLYQLFLQQSASDHQKGSLRSEVMLRLVQISSAQSLAKKTPVVL